MMSSVHVPIYMRYLFDVAIFCVRVTVMLAWRHGSTKTLENKEQSH